VTQLGWAGDFNGINYVRVANPSNGRLDFGTNDFTLSAWFNISLMTGPSKSIVSKGALSGNDLGYGMEISNDNRITCSIRGAGKQKQEIKGLSPKLGVWHYAVCVFDRDNSAFVYLDGKESASESIKDNSGSVDNALDLCIGAYCMNSNSANQKFSGQIDDVRIYNYNLSAMEIQKNYTDGITRQNKFTCK
jgi:hypothetical protein